MVAVEISGVWIALPRAPAYSGDFYTVNSIETESPPFTGALPPGKERNKIGNLHSLFLLQKKRIELGSWNFIRLNPPVLVHYIFFCIIVW